MPHLFCSGQIVCYNFIKEVKIYLLCCQVVCVMSGRRASHVHLDRGPKMNSWWVVSSVLVSKHTHWFPCGHPFFWRFLCVGSLLPSVNQRKILTVLLVFSVAWFLYLLLFSQHASAFRSRCLHGRMVMHNRPWIIQCLLTPQLLFWETHFLKRNGESSK